MTDINITDAEVIDQPITETTEVVEHIKFIKWEIKMIFNGALSSIKINDLPKEDKINLIKLKIKIGKVHSELEAYEKSVVESLKDDTYTDGEKASQNKDATEEDKEKFKELQKKLEKIANETCMDEYNSEVTIECKHITDETFYKIADSFDMTMLGGYDYIYNKLVKNDRSV